MLCLTQQSDLSVLSWKITPGMEEGGGRQDSVHGSTNVAKDNLRDLWKKLIESEERLNFFRKMVGWELNVREIEHLGDDLNNKFKSDRMKGGRSEKVVIKTIMELKLKDERRFQRELKDRREKARKDLERKEESKAEFKRIITKINGEAKRWRKCEKSKYTSKVEHIKRLRKEEEIRFLEECPHEISAYKELTIFDKKKFDKLIKEKAEVSRIGNVELDDDEIAILKLPPKFAIRGKLKRTEMQTEMQMGMAKIRYQNHKEEAVREIDEFDEINDDKLMKKRKMLSAEEIIELEELDKLDVRVLHSSVYNSQSMGLVERSVRTLKEILRF